MLRAPIRISAALAAGALACAGAAQAGQPVRPGDTTTGLGLTGPKVPDILKQAKADTYAAPAGAVCEAAAQEIAALDEVLGPDADSPAQKSSFNAGKLVTKTIRGMIPHKDVVRFLTQAGKKERELSDAAMAGWARRGYLKGLVRTAGCEGPTPAQAAAQTGQEAVLQQTSTPNPAPTGSATAASATAPDVQPAPLPLPPLEPEPAPQPAAPPSGALMTASTEPSGTSAAAAPAELAR